MFIPILLGVLVALVIKFLKHHYSYWERRGFPYDHDSSIPLGSLKSVANRDKSMGIAIYDIYLKSKEAFVGVYLLFRPGLLVRDVELTRRVLAQDFASFHDRGVYVDEERDPLSAHLFSLRGASWRTMRHKLAPSFTSGKLKAMFGTAEDIADKMVNYLNTVLPKSGSKELDLKYVLSTYSIDIIASTIFGLDTNGFENPKNKFRNILVIARKNTFLNAIFGMLVFLCPSLVRFFVVLGVKNEAGVKLQEIVKETIEYREKNGIVRKDMLQMLMQLHKSGEINEDDNDWSVKVNKNKNDFSQGISLELLTAQLFLFYIAGQETTGSTAAFTIYELAQYPKWLKKAQEDVETVLARHDGKITYDSLREMNFIELCLKETLRKYPGLPLLNRECTEDYQIPGTDKVIERGTPILISLYGIHRDPANFPDPDTYDPERFLESNHNFNHNAYMPFGEGPRHCIAQRMGMLNSKLAVVKILQNFNVEIKEREEFEYDNFSIALVPKNGVPVRLSRK